MSNLGNKEIMAKNIRHYLEINNITQTDICTALGFKPATFSDWVNAKTYPRIDKIELMSNYFGISKSDLVENHSSSSIAGVRIPVLGEIVAGLPIDAYQEILDYEEIPAALASQGEFFALKVKGDSMSPRIADGDVVICKQQSDIESGDIAVVTINGDTATLKKVVKHSTGITLVALNTAVFQPTFFTNEEVISLPVTIQGKVIELRAKF